MPDKVIRPKREFTIPSDEEDAAITAAALSDPDAQPLTDAELAQFRPTKRRGPVVLAVRKIPVTLELDSRLVDVFKAQGDDWHTIMGDALIDWVEAKGILPHEE
jgi:uncharacterized protein (DUF4415 family)